MKTYSLVLAAVLCLAMGLVTQPQAAGGRSKPQMDTQPGPAFRMVSGTLKKIKGPYYEVEEYTGNRVRLYVS